MIEVTAVAADKIKEYMAANKVDSPIRIMAQNGCAGPSLNLVLDQAGDNDQLVQQHDLTLLADREMLAATGKITIDYREASSGCGCGGGGFTVSSEKPLSGGGCGSSCNTGSCGC
ncbi:IscA/HesB family protein [Desulfurivibrio alkaliphilus]|uniref:HesB/YadR/YfhF-family protein n=1 Tax=Desulfurivibrio alkaliphilus (strain DSM 19089 / UNIQEM U267 / AHT2) TaxID=589865 RepID=D6Z1H4_DESAT|nr:IscA/HesB family protein [Desulfurivibrio alkaliphilus]ADH87308.1 HesB/YadR/YfhF-family protein [Desulfurivibrio alkaliphilus AHT 2]